MSILDIVLVGIISLVMGLALRSSLRGRGRSGCGGNCAACRGCGSSARKSR